MGAATAWALARRGRRDVRAFATQPSGSVVLQPRERRAGAADGGAEPRCVADLLSTVAYY